MRGTKRLRLRPGESPLSLPKTQPTATEAPTVDPLTLEQLRALQSARTPSLVADLVREFFASATARIGRMQAALAAADMKTLEFEAHGLAGSCGVLGVIRMRICCLELEQLASRGASAQVPTAIDEVIHRLEEARPILTEAARRT